MSGPSHGSGDELEGAENEADGPGSKSVNSVGVLCLQFLSLRLRCQLLLVLVRYPARWCCSALVESLLRYLRVVMHRTSKRIAANPTIQATNGMRNTGPGQKDQSHIKREPNVHNTLRVRHIQLRGRVNMRTQTKACGQIMHSS